MGLIVPSSTITLYSNIRIGAGEEIAFPSVASQKAYFAKHKVTEVTNCTYVRRTGTIKLELLTSVVAQCNFISFTNPAFENKTFYAKIVDYSYINNVTTEIAYEIDYFQTFMFDVTYETSNILRQHISEAGWNKANANPWVRDAQTVELFTSENLSIGKDLEKMAVEGENCYVKRGESPFWIVLSISDFDTSEIESYPDWLTKFDCYLLSNGENYCSSKYKSILEWDARQMLYVPKCTGVYGIARDGLESGRLKDVLDWLTVNNFTHNILGIFFVGSSDLRSFFKGGTTELAGEVINITPPAVGYGEDPKLYTFPFCYLRIITSEGETKEYRFEYFKQENGQTKVDFRYVFALDGNAFASVVPENYRIFYNDENVANVGERIDIRAIPQLGYTTDAFLAFIGSQYQATFSNMTTMEKGVQSVKNSVPGLAVQGAIAGIGEVANFASGMGAKGALVQSVNSISNIFQQGMEIGQQADKFNELKKVRKGNEDFSDVFGPASEVYANDQYHPISNGGYLSHYATRNGATSFIIQTVTLDPMIFNLYNTYFQFYGYASNKIGIPRICNFIKGQTEDWAVPHWVTFAEGEKRTYCKTQQMRVIAPMDVVSDYIENLFDMGVSFLKGDEM